MLALLILHIAALLFWAASLLYLPALISGGLDKSHSLSGEVGGNIAVARFLFTRIATPAALIAIVAGTGVFVLNRTVDPWLIAKLTLVTALVVVHGATGFLIIRAESAQSRTMRLWCWLVATVTALLITGIVWIVLGKPDLERWL